MRHEVAEAPRTKGYFMSLAVGVAPMGLASYAIWAGWGDYGPPVVFSISAAMVTGLFGLTGGILGISATLRPDVFHRPGMLAASWLVVVATLFCFAWFIACVANFTSFSNLSPEFTLAVYDTLTEEEKHSIAEASGCEGRDACIDALFTYFWYLSRDRLISASCILFGYVGGPPPGPGSTSDQGRRSSSRSGSSSRTGTRPSPAKSSAIPDTPPPPSIWGAPRMALAANSCRA